MVMRRGGRKSGKPRRRMGARRPAYRRRRQTSVEFASAKQTLQLPDDKSGTVYRFDNIALSAFDRMSQIAKAYQYYRITKVEVKFKPFADTYAPNNGVSSVPYLYWLIDKGVNLQLNSFNALRDAGARPIRFDDKTITVRWKPSVHLMTADVSGATIYPTYGLQKTSPWLSTNQNGGQASTTWLPSEVEHYGMLYGVQVDSGLVNEQFFGTEITVHFQFKKPLNSPGGESKSIVVSKTIMAKPEVEVVGV